MPKSTLAVVLAAMMLTGCGTTAMPSLPGSPLRSTAMVPEAFAFAPASDAHLSVEVLGVENAQGADYIPSDPNWLQIRVRVSNVGRGTANLARAGARLADGSVLNSASSASEIIKPPNLVREGLTNTGLGVGAMAAGALLFPPAAIVGGAIMAFRPMFAADRVGRIAERINREGLRVGPIAPGTNVMGLLFVPAVTGQTGLVVFYDVAGSQESLVVERTPN